MEQNKGCNASQSVSDNYSVSCKTDNRSILCYAGAHADDGGRTERGVNVSCLQIYQYGFVDYKPQLALALGVIQFIILMVLTCFYFKIDKKVGEGI